MCTTGTRLGRRGGGGGWQGEQTPAMAGTPLHSVWQQQGNFWGEGAHEHLSSAESPPREPCAFAKKNWSLPQLTSTRRGATCARSVQPEGKWPALAMAVAAPRALPGSCSRDLCHVLPGCDFSRPPKILKIFLKIKIMRPISAWQLPLLGSWGLA